MKPCHAAEVVGESLLQQLRMNSRKAAARNLAKIETMLEREHHGLDCKSAGYAHRRTRHCSNPRPR